MRVLCKANNGRSLSAKYFDRNYASPSSDFDLDPGREYVVYGISLWKGLLLYLIIGEGMYPHWYPSELFSITRNEMPSGWHFTRRSEDEGYQVTAIWGYAELVNEEEHFDDLSNLEKSAVELFVERQRQIDEVS